MLEVAREAFTASMRTTFAVSAVGVLAAAVVAVLVMRKGEKAVEVASEEPELVA